MDPWLCVKGREDAMEAMEAIIYRIMLKLKFQDIGIWLEFLHR